MAGAHHVLELHQRMDAEPAVGVARGIAAQHLAHAGGAKLPRVDGVKDAPAGVRLGARGLALVVNLLAHADQRGRDRFPHQRLVDPVRPAVVADQREAVDAAEVRRDPDVVLLGEPDVLVVDLLVAHAVQEAFDAGADHQLGVGEVEHMADRAQPELLGLIGRGGEHLRRQLGGAAAAIVDPDLDEVGLERGELAHEAARILGAGDRERHVVR